MNFERGASRFAILVYRAIGASLAIGIMEVLASAAHEPLARVPFVTSIVLVTALPDSEPAQSRAVILGHLISCLVGLAAQLVLGPGETTSAVAVGLATLAMIVTRTLHPPAGIDAFLLASQDLPAQWMLSPVLVGAVLLAGFARIWAMGERKWLATIDKRGVE